VAQGPWQESIEEARSRDRLTHLEKEAKQAFSQVEPELLDPGITDLESAEMGEISFYR
jgi:hypothetical protein